MTNETTQTHTPDPKPISFGTRLRTARESLGLERKDVASQLRLNETTILMLEKERYPSDLPPTFIRGYMRSYAKFLQIPEYEIKKAIEPIKSKLNTQGHALPVLKELTPVTSSNYFMQFFTYLIMLTLLGLVGMWWYTHTPSTQSSENQLAAMGENTAATSTAVVAPAPAPVEKAKPATPAPEKVAPTAKNHDNAAQEDDDDDNDDDNDATD